ncbi:MAG: 7-carboxy-7-deazaguanine synthase QueE [Ferruginibacter sp.]
MIRATVDTIGLPVMESFYTIQGEGYYQGSAAYFVRLGGCDVGCVWCDVKESWDISLHPVRSIKSIVNEIKNTSAEIVVITGGEPLLHNLDDLTDSLHQNSLQTNIETSASSPLTGKWDWICVSPKKFKAPLPEILLQANELKVVIYNSSDFAWAEKHASMVSSKCKLYLQPEWSRDALVTAAIVEYIKKNPRWCLSVQVHKYINVP